MPPRADVLQWEHLPFLNTLEDNARLAAAKRILRARKVK